MKKEKKTNRINFRCSNEEWAFYQSLKESGLNKILQIAIFFPFLYFL